MGCVSAKPSPSVIGPVAVPVASRKRRVLGAPPDDIVQRIREKFSVVQDRHVRRLHTCYQSYAEPAGDLSVLSLRSIFNQIPYGDLAANSGREHGQPMPHSEPIIQRLLALAGVGQNHGLSFTQFADVICTYLLLGTPQKAEDQLEFLFDCFSTGGARRSHFFGDGGRVDRARRHASQQVTVTTNLHAIDVDSPEDISVLPARRASNEDGRPAARSIGQLDEPYLNREQLQQLLSLGSVYPNTPPDIQATLAQLGGRIGSVLQHMGVENKNVVAAQGRSPNAHVDSSDLSADLRLPFPQFAELCHLHPVLLWALNRLRLRVLNIVLGTTDWLDICKGMENITPGHGDALADYPSQISGQPSVILAQSGDAPMPTPDDRHESERASAADRESHLPSTLTSSGESTSTATPLPVAVRPTPDGVTPFHVVTETLIQGENQERGQFTEIPSLVTDSNWNVDTPYDDELFFPTPGGDVLVPSQWTYATPHGTFPTPHDAVVGSTPSSTSGREDGNRSTPDNFRTVTPLATAVTTSATGTATVGRGARAHARQHKRLKEGESDSRRQSSSRVARKAMQLGRHVPTAMNPNAFISMSSGTAFHSSGASMGHMLPPQRFSGAAWHHHPSRSADAVMGATDSVSAALASNAANDRFRLPEAPALIHRDPPVLKPVAARSRPSLAVRPNALWQRRREQYRSKSASRMHHTRALSDYAFSPHGHDSDASVSSGPGTHSATFSDSIAQTATAMASEEPRPPQQHTMTHSSSWDQLHFSWPQQLQNYRAQTVHMQPAAQVHPDQTGLGSRQSSAPPQPSSASSGSVMVEERTIGIRMASTASTASASRTQSSSLSVGGATAVRMVSTGSTASAGHAQPQSSGFSVASGPGYTPVGATAAVPNAALNAQFLSQFLQSSMPSSSSPSRPSGLAASTMTRSSLDRTDSRAVSPPQSQHQLHASIAGARPSVTSSKDGSAQSLRLIQPLNVHVSREESESFSITEVIPLTIDASGRAVLSPHAPSSTSMTLREMRQRHQAMPAADLDSPQVGNFELTPGSQSDMGSPRSGDSLSGKRMDEMAELRVSGGAVSNTFASPQGASANLNSLPLDHMRSLRVAVSASTIDSSMPALSSAESLGAGVPDVPANDFKPTASTGSSDGSAIAQLRRVQAPLTESDAGGPAGQRSAFRVSSSDTTLAGLRASRRGGPRPPKQFTFAAATVSRPVQPIPLPMPVTSASAQASAGLGANIKQWAQQLDRRGVSHDARAAMDALAAIDVDNLSTDSFSPIGSP